MSNSRKSGGKATGLLGNTNSNNATTTHSNH